MIILDASSSLRFELESMHEVTFLEKLRVQDLNRDPPRDQPVFALEDRAHAPAPQRAQHAVLSVDELSDSNGHSFNSLPRQLVPRASMLGNAVQFASSACALLDERPGSS